MKIVDKSKLIDLKVSGLEMSISEIYSGVSLKAEHQTINLCERDGVFEINLGDGRWFRITDGEIVYDDTVGNITHTLPEWAAVTGIDSYGFLCYKEDGGEARKNKCYVGNDVEVIKEHKYNNRVVVILREKVENDDQDCCCG